MNPFATESILQYDYRRCAEDLELARLKRRIVKSLLAAALRLNANDQIVVINEWLPKSKRQINRLSARRTRLRRKLDSQKAQSQLSGNSDADRSLPFNTGASDLPGAYEP
jgi:hypothetical protein